MTVHVFFLFPETAGKTLEEVESMFLAGEHAWNTHVEYGRIVAVEKGQVDPEKLAGFGHAENAAIAENAENSDNAENNKAVEAGEAVPPA